MRTTLIFMAALLAAAAAPAHVSLEQPQALAGSPYKAVLRVGHGCDGRATHTLRVQLPAGFRGAKPMPKAGWALTVQRAALAEPYEAHGRKVGDDVVEITWTASSRESELDDAHYDEFVLRGQAPARAGPLWFKVQQVCERGALNWNEIPAQGTATEGLKAPAALLQVLPNGAAEHRH